MKLFFRFPELLLPVAILLTPLLIGNRTVDIMVHDTYYIFGRTKWGVNAIAVSVFVLLGLTWLTHLLARKKDLLSVKGRWVQVGLTLLTLGFIVPILSSKLFIPADYKHFDLLTCNRFFFRMYTLNWMLFLFLLTQLAFWITVIILAIRKKLYHK